MTLKVFYFLQSQNTRQMLQCDWQRGEKNEVHSSFSPETRSTSLRVTISLSETDLFGAAFYSHHNPIKLYYRGKIKAVQHARLQ